MSTTRPNSKLDLGQVERANATRAAISAREHQEIVAANASGSTPVVFIHGLWLLPSSWANWADLFKQAGYAPLTPDWPDDPETVEEARAHPEILARKTLKQVADHTTEIIDALDQKPVVIGHSTGGLLAQMLAGRGLSAATVAIDPGVFRGVLPMDELVRKALDARHDPRQVITDLDARYFGTPLEHRSLLPGDGAQIGETHLADWQHAMLSAPPR